MRRIFYTILIFGVVFHLMGCTPEHGDGTIVKNRNQEGNSTGNINNYAFVAEQDDWIFFTNSADPHIPLLDLRNGLFKMEKNGKQATRINRDLPSYINVVDEWIYYTVDTGLSRPNSKLYRVKIDGSQKQRLSNDDVSDVHVVGDDIYYVNLSDHNHLYKMKTDGSNKRKLNNHNSSSINIVGRWIYYIHYH
ncbi:hypothetical protein AT864_03368 [Anoxybacillus sp. P3H1B]|uniref:DUF5050 domain-containing protein n=1 Tax=Anoxybacillus sp. P3H1B TaxID=1769293 RepID=UPI0007932292|nr:DUF5050 domain-containing protein [Anoxybacillus sp. P3H1B]KXG08420.1 hypothetical protein AT864_03368 [Anoxybacillus sp. P3H1B]